MTTTHQVGPRIRISARALVGIPVTTIALATALFALGTIVGSDDVPSAGSSASTVTEPTGGTVPDAMATDGVFAAFGWAPETLPEALVTDGVYPIPTGSTRTLPEALVTDGVYPIPTAYARTMPEALVTDGVYPIPTAYTRTMPKAIVTDGVLPVPQVSTTHAAEPAAAPADTRHGAVVDGGLAELTIETLLGGSGVTRTVFPAPLTLTNDPIVRGLIEQHQAWLEPQLTPYL